MYQSIPLPAIGSTSSKVLIVPQASRPPPLTSFSSGYGPSSLRSPPLVTGVSFHPLPTTSGIYPGPLHLARTIHSFVKRRRRLRDIITSNSNLNYDYYWRLFTLASLDFCITIPLSLWDMIYRATHGAFPWVSQATVHSSVYQVPKALQDQYPFLTWGPEVSRWIAILYAFVFFAFFGSAEEAKNNYRLLASTIAKLLGCTTPNRSSAIPDMRANGRSRDPPLRFVCPVSSTRQTGSSGDSYLFLGGPLAAINQYDSRLTLIPLRNDHLLPTAPWWPRLPTRFQEFQKLSSIRFMTRASVEGSHDPHHPLFPPPRSTLLYTPPNAQTSHLPDFRNTSFHPTKLGISPFTFILFGELLLETYTALFVVAPYSPRISRLAIPFNCLTSPSPSSPWMF